MSILLEDTEIRAELEANGIEGSPYIEYACQVLSEAQLKKVIEHFDGICNEHHPYPDRPTDKRKCEQCWQTLLEEVRC